MKTSICIMVHKVQKIVIVIVLASIGLLFNSCFFNEKNTIEGNYNGEKYVLQSGENAVWRLQLGTLPALDISPVTTSWGPPYSDAVFGDKPHEYIAGKGRAYNNEVYAPGKNFIVYSMLYVSPEAVSKAVFEKYCRFMKDEWGKINGIADEKKYTTLPDIIGLAYGNPESFTQDFYGTYDGKKMIVRIEADGRVKFISDDKVANENYSGLSMKVQMPGKKLWFDTAANNSGFTISQLDSFKNKQQELLVKLFDIVPGREMANNQLNIESKLCYKWHLVSMQARGRRQPLEQDEDGSYMWFKGDGTFEDFAPNAIKNGTWNYDAKTQSLQTVEDSISTTNTIRSITEKELILISKSANAGEVSIVFKRIN